MPVVKSCDFLGNDYLSQRAECNSQKIFVSRPKMGLNSSPKSLFMDNGPYLISQFKDAPFFVVFITRNCSLLFTALFYWFHMGLKMLLWFTGKCHQNVLKSSMKQITKRTGVRCWLPNGSHSTEEFMRERLKIPTLWREYRRLEDCDALWCSFLRHQNKNPKCAHSASKIEQVGIITYLVTMIKRSLLPSAVYCLCLNRLKFFPE